MNDIINKYEQYGGVFITPPSVLTQKLSKIKALLFDWDGVFNNGIKSHNSGSGFSEADSMGLNMVRFSMWLNQSNKERIKAAIITGETNPTAFSFARREGFDTVYYQMKDKRKALEHFCNKHNITQEEVAFFFDDILDLSVAEKTGVRFQINRTAGIALKHYTTENKLADYITINDGGNAGLREISELWLCLNNSFDQVVKKRIQFSGDYSEFISQRNSISTDFYILKGDLVEQIKVD
ncbi:MAG: phosphatase [Cytophagaceae bacterium]